MTWWQWGLAVLVAAAGIAFGGFKYGVTTQRKDDADARLRLAVQVDSARTAHAAEVAAIAAELVSRGVELTHADYRARVAEAARQSVTNEALAARDALKASQTTADSLSAYPPLVDALTRELEVADSARVAYRDEVAASHERAGLLLRRIAADSTLIQRQAVIIANIIPPPPPSKSGWGCVAGVTVATGLRTGAGLGVTCGRKL